MKKELTIYSTPSCHYCKVAKEFFVKNNIPYKEIDVVKDIEARKMIIDRSGQRGVPVIILGDTIITGFDEEKGRLIKKEYNEN